MPCQRLATLGTTVCQVHGAAAPQVLKAANERLRELFDPALAEIARILDSNQNATIDDHVRLTAARDILDRLGHTAPKRLALGQDPDGEPLQVQVVYVDAMEILDTV